MDQLVLTYAAVAAWLGWAVMAALLAVLYWLSGQIGVVVFRRLTRVYHISVMGYWLSRLEAVGVRDFQKAEKEDVEIQKARSASAWDASLGKPRTERS